MTTQIEHSVITYVATTVWKVEIHAGIGISAFLEQQIPSVLEILQANYFEASRVFGFSSYVEKASKVLQSIESVLWPEDCPIDFHTHLTVTCICKYNNTGASMTKRN